MDEMSEHNGFDNMEIMPPPKRTLTRHNSDLSVDSDLSAINLENGGFVATAPSDVTGSHQRTGSSTSTHQETYYSMANSIASTSYYSVKRGPTHASSLRGDTSSLAVPSTYSSQQQSKPSTLASLKILSPEELEQNPHFLAAELTPRSEGQSSSDASAQQHPMGPWTPATHPNKFLPPSSRSTNEYSRSNVTSPTLSHTREALLISNTRLATSDTKIIMNINASDNINPASPGRRSSRISSNSFVHTPSERNIRLIKKLEKASQTSLNASQPTINKGTSSLYITTSLDSSEDNSEKPQLGLVSLLRTCKNLENVHGFFGAAVKAIASIPTPAMLAQQEEQYYNVQHLKESSELHIGLKFYLRTYPRLARQFLFSLRGFFLTLYFFTVLGWALFLVIILCNGAPAMSREYGPDNVQHSPRRIWIEACTQVINGLFCIAGLGLFLFRARDVYLWTKSAVTGDIYCTQKILNIHSDWFWGGFSRPWKLFVVIFLHMASSIFQVLLCVVMWHYNKYDRPTWATASLIGTSASFVVMSGFIMGIEARRIMIYCRESGHTRYKGFAYDSTITP